jgi:hypothetical protein
MFFPLAGWLEQRVRELYVIVEKGTLSPLGGGFLVFFVPFSSSFLFPSPAIEETSAGGSGREEEGTAPR